MTNLSLCLTNLAPRDQDVWWSGGINLNILNFNRRNEWSSPRPGERALLDFGQEAV